MKKQTLRGDRRSWDQLRPIRIKRHYLKYAEGSCLIEWGATRVICSASVEEKVPPFLRDTGKGWITSEYGMLPRSCNTRIQREASRGRADGRTYEIQRLIGRSLRAVVDLERLGERSIWIDCDVVQGDGGTRCASITGSFIALVEALSFLKQKGMLQGKLPVKDFVAATSVGLVNGTPLLDLSYQEDSKAQVDMNVVMTGSEKLIEVQGTAEGSPFDQAALNRLIRLARSGIRQLVTLQQKILGPIL